MGGARRLSLTDEITVSCLPTGRRVLASLGSKRAGAPIRTPVLHTLLVGIVPFLPDMYLFRRRQGQGRYAPVRSSVESAEKKTSTKYYRKKGEGVRLEIPGSIGVGRSLGDHTIKGLCQLCR
jgi:hypothetical protein